MTLFRGKYRIESARKQGFDYASTGCYFFTIITKNRQHFFGLIQGDEMILSVSGKVVWECWWDVPMHYPDIKTGAFIVMPDHVHGILIINQGNMLNHIPTLGNVIGSFKSAVTKKIRENENPDFGWIPRFHDYIIRNEPERIIIERYIHDNPRRWRDPSR